MLASSLSPEATAQLQHSLAQRRQPRLISEAVSQLLPVERVQHVRQDTSAFARFQQQLERQEEEILLFASQEKAHQRCCSPNVLNAVLGVSPPHMQDIRL